MQYLEKSFGKMPVPSTAIRIQMEELQLVGDGLSQTAETTHKLKKEQSHADFSRKFDVIDGLRPSRALWAARAFRLGCVRSPSDSFEPDSTCFEHRRKHA
jgi:hypothetical protein